MNIGKTLLIGVASALLVCGIAGCAPTPSSEKHSASEDSDQSVSQRAIVLRIQDGTALFADESTQNVYVPGLPEGAIYGLDGDTIAASELQPGNIVEVDGNGIMLESYPGQYPGITRIAVVEKGSIDSIEPYRAVIDQVFAEQDPYEMPSGHVDYTNDQASVSVMLPASSWEWDTADDFRSIKDGSPFNADGTLIADMPDARIGSATEAVLGFAAKPTDIQVTAQAVVASMNGAFVLADPTAAASPCETSRTDSGEFKLTIEPAQLYTVYGFFEHGNATYQFYTI